MAIDQARAVSAVDVHRTALLLSEPGHADQTTMSATTVALARAATHDGWAFTEHTQDRRHVGILWVRKGATTHLSEAYKLGASRCRPGLP